VAIDGWAQDHLEGFTADAVPGAQWVGLGRGACLLPGVAGTDGMYCLVLRAPG